MPITDKGRWTSTILDERGRIVKGSLTEYGGIVFGVPITQSQVLVYDSFNRANNPNSLGIADTGQSWTVWAVNPNDVTKYGIVNNQAYMQDTNSEDNQFAGFDVGKSDVIISATHTVLNYWNTIVFRAVSETNHFQFKYDGFNKCYVVDYYDGSSWSTIATTGTTTPRPANGDKISIKLQGELIKVFINGNERLSFTSTTNLKATKHGINFQGDTTNRLDDFKIESISSSAPTTSPIPTVVSVSRSKISDETGVNSAIIRFKFDVDVTQWSVNVMGTSSTTGTIADSGGMVTAGTEITASIEWNELYQEGQNKVNIYGLNEIGWTPYEEDPNAVKKYYLKMDGVDDYIKSPTITFDEVIMEFKARQDPTNEYYIDVRTGGANTYLYRNTSGIDFASGSSYFINGMYWNDVKFSNNSVAIGYNTRGTLRLLSSTQLTDDINFFSNNTASASTFMSADVYSIKLLLGGVVKAFYDMSTGTIQDQSGNGNHPTLYGNPTWVSY